MTSPCQIGQKGRRANLVTRATCRRGGGSSTELSRGAEDDVKVTCADAQRGVTTGDRSRPKRDSPLRECKKDDISLLFCHLE